MVKIPTPKLGATITRKSRKGMNSVTHDLTSRKYKTIRRAQKNSASRRKQQLRNEDRVNKRQYKYDTAKQRASVQKSAVRSGAASSTSSSAMYNASEAAQAESAAKTRNSEVIVMQADGGIGSSGNSGTPSPDVASGDAEFVGRK